MDKEECRKAVYSNDWYDFILRRDDPLPDVGEEQCLINTDGSYRAWYYKPNALQPIGFGTYTYSAVPKCFTPLSARALDVSGILRVRSQPNLALTGEGVLIGIVDSGDGVILLRQPGGPVSGLLCFL